MRDLKVALIQSNLHWENITGNLQMFEEKILRISEPFDLVLLPEMFSTGFSMNAEKLAEDMNGSAVQWMKKIAAQKKCAVTGSLIILDSGKFFNRLVWCGADGKISFYDKRHLFSLTSENQTFTSGKEKIIVELNGWKILPLICYDLRFPVWSRNKFNSAANGAEYDLLIYVANWPERRNTAWRQLLIARAIENQSYVVGVNRVGTDASGIYHSGDSMAIDVLGNIIYTKAHDEDVNVITLDFSNLLQVRNQFQFLKDGDEFTIHS